MSTILFEAIKTQAKITDSVIVAFSGGKDAIVTLDLCNKYFKKVTPFYMYLVKGLSYQERVLQYYENKYNQEIIRVPHFLLGDMMKRGQFTEIDNTATIIKQNDVYDYVRQQTGFTYIAGGERISDSIERRATIKKSGVIDDFSKRFYPIAYWKKKDVYSYIDFKKLYLPRMFKQFDNSCNGLNAELLLYVREYYNDDYRKIEKIFPFIGAVIARYENYGK